MYKKIINILNTTTVRQSFITVVSTFLAAGLGAVFYLALARVMGPREYGIFSLILTLITLSVTVAELGMSQGIIKFAAKSLGGDKHLPYLKLALLTKIGVGIILGLVLWLFPKIIAVSLLHQPDVAPLLPLAGLSILGVLLFGYSISVFQGLQKFLLWGLFQTGANLIRLIFMGLSALFVRINSFWGLVLFASAPITGFFSSWFFLPRRTLQVSVSSNHIKQFWDFSKWTAAFTITSSIAARLDMFLTARFLDLSQTGIYALAAIMASFLPQLSSAIGAVTATKFASFSDHSHSQKYLRKALLFSVGVSLTVALTLIPTALVVIRFTGKDFSVSFAPFIILLLSLAIFTSLNPIRDSILYFYHRPQFFFWTGLAQALILIIAGGLLIPAFGIMGTAVSVLISHIFMALACIWQYQQLSKKA